MFAKYDTDGDRILDPEEQRHLAEDLLKQKDSLNAELSKIQEQQKDGETPASLADLMVRLTYFKWACVSSQVFNNLLKKCNFLHDTQMKTWSHSGTQIHLVYYPGLL